MAVINASLAETSLPLTVILGKEATWVDEWDWTPVPQVVRKTLDGTLVVETISPQADGRPITLEVKNLAKATVDSLITLRDRSTPQTEMTLTLCDTNTHTVYFRHHDFPPIEVKPIMKRPDYTRGADYWDVLIKLIKKT